MGTIAVRSFRVFGNLAQKAGPYMLLEILLPGGSLFALLLFLYRRSRELGATDERRMSAGIGRAIGRAHREMVCIALPWDIASAWRGRHRERDGLEALAMAPTL